MNYFSNGVHVTPTIISQGDKVKVEYKGLLWNSGADQVYAHVGTGNSWSNQQDIPMSKKINGFETIINVNGKDDLNIAFKDCADNWDNNNGHNYTFRVH